MIGEKSSIIVFDSLCVLCSAFAQFILRHDSAHYFQLASMQGLLGAELYLRSGIDPANPNTIIVVNGDVTLRNSDAILAIYRQLEWPWNMLAFFSIVPRPLRDLIYLWLARNRYRIFGRRESCWKPSTEHLNRIL